MAFKIVSTTRFPQNPFPYVPARPAPLENAAENGMEDPPIIGGILPDLKHIWNAKGPCLEVRNIRTGHKVGCWTFGKLLGDYGVSITAVQELKRSRCNISLLVVALNSPASGGQVCIFDTYGSKVLRVIQLGEQITSIYVVDHGCETSSLPETTPLKYFDGILAIGTVGATVYLMDLCKQISEDVIHNWDCNVRNELNPCPVVILKKEKQGDIRKYIEKCVDSHVALCLNESSDSKKGYFALKGEDGNERVCVNRVEAEVSALLYSQQLGSLLIGYNFGSFQLWDLSSVELCYTSPICEGNIPVAHFTVQEPADDPKSYCYVWVSYSHTLFLQSGLPYAVMYSFLYDTKSYLNGFGNVYENFQHCTLRFQIELGDTESSSLKSKVQGGLCLGFQSVTKRPLNKDLNSTALCLVSWLFWNAEGEANTAILLFDLNQWYKEQMPRVPNWLNCSSYMIRHTMKEIALDVKMDQKSLSQFMGVQRLEEHFFPTALSFDLWGVTENSLLKINNKGLQKSFLDRIALDGHLALVKPDDFAEQVVSLGLVPLFCDVSLNNSADLAYQREILLNVALEHRLLFWLCDSTTKLANGSFSAAGLNLFDVLNWAFQRAVYIKTCCDKYCEPLFDYSGIKLDDNTTTLIACGTGQIRTLCSFYRHVTEKLAVHVDQEALLEERKSLENVVVYFEVLLWMVDIGLLPEYPPSPNITLVATAPYLVQNLTEYYNKKRVQLQLACKETFVDKDCLLFIDNMINYRGCAEVLRQQWQEDGGSGLYPPPSLQSVLRTYLLDGADLNFKHSLVFYVLLDIAMTLDENDTLIRIPLVKFPQIFNLTLSKIKIVQAFWNLDHDYYEIATQTILDSCVLPLDLQHWHHSVMMRSLLMQDHSSLALLYLEVRKPTLQEKKDLLTVLSLLVSKNMLDEAFKFRQQYEGPTEHALLQHIFEECNKNGFLYTLLHRQMDAEEEKVFFQYLQRTGNSQCQDLQIFYYLQRARFLEAFDTYSSRKRKLPDSQGLIGHRDASAADNILIMFKNLLPDVNRDLVELVRKERQTLWKEVPRPTPLSVFVHNASEKIRYKSSVIFAALSKAKQTFNDTLSDTKIGTEDTPFLRTPSLVRSKPRTDTPLMKSRVIQHNESGEIDEYCGPTPSKKLKLSARSFRMSMSESLSVSNVRSILTTPIVKRKRQSTEQVDITTNWPHSILKSATKPLVEDTRFEESLINNVTSDARGCISRATFELSPRKSMRTPLKGHVKFDIIRNSCSSSEEPSLRSSILSNISTGDSRRVSKNSSISIAEDDSVFYSPEVNVKTSPKNIEEERKKSLPKEKLEFNNDDEIPKDEPMPENPLKVEESICSGNMKNFQSPRARRSYKRSFEESPIPVRSSPRLTRKTISENKTSLEKQPQSLPEIPPSPSTNQKLRGRRSLARSVLEQNAFSALNEDQPSVLVASNKSSFSSFSSFNSSIDLDSTDSSWQELLDRCKQAEVEYGETSREVSVVTTRRESLRRRDTGVLVTSKEVVEKMQSRTVEVVAADDGNEENKEETTALQLDEEEKQPENSPKGEEEEFNVYDDLSSGSEDVREVLQNLDKTNLGKTYADLTQSGSFCRQDDDENRRSASEGSPMGLNQARITSQDFIEIGSSSDEEATLSHRSSSTPRYEPESSDRNSQSYDSSSRGSENVQASEHSRLSSRIDEDAETQEGPFSQSRQHDEVDEDEDTTEFPAVSYGNHPKKQSESLDYEDELVVHQDDGVPENIFEEAFRGQIDEDEETQEVPRQHDEIINVDDGEDTTEFRAVSSGMAQTNHLEIMDDEDEETQEVPRQHYEVLNVDDDEDTTEFRAVSSDMAQTNHLEIIDEEEELDQDGEFPDHLFEEASRTTETQGDSSHSTTANSNLSVEDPLKVDPVETKSVSLQCTIATGNLNDKSREMHEISEEPLKCNSAEVETQSISLQCTIDSNKSADIEKESNYSVPEQQSVLEDSVFVSESAGNIFEEDDLMEEGGASPDSPGVAAVGEDNEPIIEKTIVMRSVRKTYKGRKTKLEMSEDVDATPKVAVDKIKHTYARSKTSFKASENSTEVEKDDTQNKSDETENATNTNAEEKSPEATPIRMTRRRSRLYSQGSTSTEDTATQSVSAGSKESDSTIHRSLFDEMSFFETPEQKAINEGEAKPKPLPVRLRRTSKGRVSESDTGQTEDTKAVSSKISTRAPSKSRETTEPSKAVAAVKPVRRTRSVSVDQPPPLNFAIGKKRSTRSKSVDIDDAVTSGQLRTTLPPIEEQPGTSADSQTRARPSSSLGDYTTSRRLTRNQASMLKTISKVEQEVKKLEEGLGSDSVQVGFERKKLRTRTQSVGSISVTSEQSEGSSPPKRSKESDQEGDHVTESKTRGKRARSASVSSVKSNTSVSSVRSTRSRRLAEIQEEIGSNEEESSSSSVKNRRGGKK